MVPCASLDALEQRQVLYPLPGFELRFLGRFVRSHNSRTTTHTVLFMACTSRRKTNRSLLSRTSELHINDFQHSDRKFMRNCLA